MPNFKPLSLVAGAVIALAAFSSPVSAGVIDPDPQIFVCTGCTSPPGGDPNIIDPTSINVGFAGNHSAVSPLLIVVGVPSGGPNPTISLPSGVSPAAAATYYGAATNGALTGDLDGTLTAASSNAYASVGLTTGAGGGASESFVNWTTMSPGGIDAGVTSFDLFVYGIDFALDSGPGGNSPINIDFSSIAAGSYVIAYNCATAGTTCSGGDIGETPFTNAGIVTTTIITTTGPPLIPEPGTLALFGTALVAFGLIRRRKAD